MNARVAALLLTAALAGPAPAQEDDLPALPPVEWTQQGASAGAGRWAVVVLADTYANAAWNLASADAVLERLRKALDAGLGIRGERLLVLRGDQVTGPTIGRTLRHLGERLRGPNNLVVFYYYGHGWTEQNALRLFTKDTDQTEGGQFVDTFGWSDLGKQLAELWDVARRRQADVKVVSVIDACRVRTQAPPGPAAYAPLEKVVAALFATKVGTFANEGVFADAFGGALEAFAGREVTKLGDVVDATVRTLADKKTGQEPELAQGERDLVLRRVDDLAVEVEAWDPIGPGKRLEGATVTLGPKRGPAPLAVAGLRPGLHDLTVEAPGYLPRRASLDLAAGHAGRVVRVPLLPALVVVAGQLDVAAGTTARVRLAATRPEGTIDGYHRLQVERAGPGPFALRLPAVAAGLQLLVEAGGQELRVDVPAQPAGVVGALRVPRHDVGRVRLGAPAPEAGPPEAPDERVADLTATLEGGRVHLRWTWRIRDNAEVIEVHRRAKGAAESQLVERVGAARVDVVVDGGLEDRFQLRLARSGRLSNPCGVAAFELPMAELSAAPAGPGKVRLTWEWRSLGLDAVEIYRRPGGQGEEKLVEQVGPAVRERIVDGQPGDAFLLRRARTGKPSNTVVVKAGLADLSLEPRGGGQVRLWWRWTFQEFGVVELRRRRGEEDALVAPVPKRDVELRLEAVPGDALYLRHAQSGRESNVVVVADEAAPSADALQAARVLLVMRPQAIPTAPAFGKPIERAEVEEKDLSFVVRTLPDAGKAWLMRALVRWSRGDAWGCASDAERALELLAQQEGAPWPDVARAARFACLARHRRASDPLLPESAAKEVASAEFRRLAAVGAEAALKAGPRDPALEADPTLASAVYWLARSHDLAAKELEAAGAPKAEQRAALQEAARGYQALRSLGRGVPPEAQTWMSQSTDVTRRLRELGP